MFIYSEQVKSFLSNIEENTCELLNKNCINSLISASDKNDIKSIIIYANDLIYLNTLSDLYLKKKFNIPKIVKKTLQYDELDYEYSTYHYEFDYNTNYVNFIKSIISNKNILNKQFVFVIKNIDNISKHDQMPLKYLLDYNGNIQYIFLVKCLNIDSAIISRSTCINAHFPLSNIYNFLKKYINLNITMEEFNELYFTTANRSIISTIVLINDIGTKPKIIECLDTLLEKMKKEKNGLTLISAIRDYVYKIYHINTPLNYISIYIINKYSKHKKIHDIVNLSAQCDASSKTILTYEKYFINLYHIIK